MLALSKADLVDRRGGRRGRRNWLAAARPASVPRDRDLVGHGARAGRAGGRVAHADRASPARRERPSTARSTSPSVPASSRSTACSAPPPARAIGSSGSASGSFRVSGEGVERLVARYDLDNEEALAHLERRLRGIGVIRALEAEGFEPGDDVEIAGVAFELDPDRVGSRARPEANRERRVDARAHWVRSWRSRLHCRHESRPRAQACCGSARTTGSRASSRRSRRRSTRPSRGDWILIGPGDYKTSSSRRAPKGAPTFPAGVLITKPRCYIRGMNRNTVIVDGTKPGSAPCSAQGRPELRPAAQGRAARPQRDHGLEGRRRLDPEPDRLQLPRRASGDGTGNEIWWNGGRRQRQDRRPRATRLVSDRDQHVLRRPSATAGRVRDLLEQLERRHVGSDLRQQLQRLGLLHRRLPAASATRRSTTPGASTTRSATRARTRADSWSSRTRSSTTTRTASTPTARTATTRRRRTAPARTARQARSPRTHSCWVFMQQLRPRQQQPQRPGRRRRAAAGPVGTGMSISGGRNDTVMDNRFVNNNAWGVIVRALSGQRDPPCTGGTLEGDIIAARHTAAACTTTGATR